MRKIFYIIGLGFWIAQFILFLQGRDIGNVVLGCAIFICITDFLKEFIYEYINEEVE